MKARTLQRSATARLKESPAIDHWQKGREKIEAEILMIDLLGYDPEPDEKLSAKKTKTYQAWVERRFTGEPIAHITGITDFRELELTVEPGVFVPRDSSEWLVECAVRRLRKRKHPVHVDLASGMGTIALAVAHEVPAAEVFGAELSEAGVRLARKNARRLGLHARFGAGDLFEPVPAKLKGHVDVITIHPPYVAKHEVADLPD
jgi:release factor glutamine methyltransferase